MISDLNKIDLKNLNAIELDNLSVLDIHLSLDQLDNEETSIVLKKLSSEKLNTVIDIYTWDKDNFLEDEFSIFIHKFLSLDYEEAYKQIKKINQDAILLFLSKVINISWYDKDQNYDDDPIITDDFTFLIRPKNENVSEVSFNVADSIIKNLYLNDFTYARKICIDLIALINLEHEELCFKFKNSRLEEEGIPSYIEALDLYFYEKPVNIIKKILNSMDNKYLKKHDPLDTYIISKHTIVNKDYFDKYFNNIPKELEEIIKIEFSSLITASIVVNNALNKDAKLILGIIKRSFNYFTLGFELIKEYKEVDVYKLLNYVPLKDIFRLGFSLLIDLKRNATKLKKILDSLNNNLLLNNEDEEFINNILKPIPLFFTSFNEKVDDFSSLKEVKEARIRISSISKKIAKL